MASVQGEAAVLTLSNQRVGQKGTVERKTIRINLKAVNGLLVVLLFSTFLFYLSCGIARDASGVNLGKKKAEYAQITEENSRLESRADYLGSYDYLEDKINNLGMVKAENIKVINAGDQVAKK